MDCALCEAPNARHEHDFSRTEDVHEPIWFEVVLCDDCDAAEQRWSEHNCRRENLIDDLIRG